MLIEDVACPVENLGAMTMDLVEMFQKYGYHDASCFGHALEGNLHLVFSQVRWAPCCHLCTACPDTLPAWSIRVLVGSVHSDAAAAVCSTSPVLITCHHTGCS